MPEPLTPATPVTAPPGPSKYFGTIPEVSAGLLYSEAAAVWRKWNPVFWFGIRFRGCLAEAPYEDAYRTVQPGAPPRSLLRRLTSFVTQRLLRTRRGDASSAATQQPREGLT